MMKRICVCMVALAILLAALTPFAVAEQTRVTRCDLRLRKEANSKSDTLVVVPGGAELPILGRSGGWSKTTYLGHTGYVSTDYLMDLTRSGYYPLKEGDENPYVKELQDRLITLGYMTGSPDGKFGKSTLDAVISFQKTNNMKADGIAGGETQRILFGDTAKAATGQTVDAAPSASSPTTNATAAPTAAPSSQTLRLGDRGEDVKSLQARLIELGYLSGKADGIFGADTEKAVVAFQKLSSLTADGKAGKVTQNLLYSNGAKTAQGTTAPAEKPSDTATASYTTLKAGMTNNEVKKLQERLIALKYLDTKATGYYGSATKAAVEKFQALHNLKVDGIAGAGTQQQLFASSAKANGASSTSGSESMQKYDTLKYGMKSSAVTTMQKKLKSLGYLSASATGYFGTETQKAVVQFQKAHKLAADGVAGSATLSKLYSESAAAAGSSGGSSQSNAPGKISGPSASSVKLLHWFNQVKPSLKNGSILQVYDPATGYGWKLRAMSLGRHCDSEPLTAEDTLYMNAAFGNVTTWTPKVVWVQLPSGSWSFATMHNVAHLSGGIANNNFDGHLCVHFLRDMDEVSKNDPNYGVQHQKAIREGWKKLTGQVIN